MKALSLRERERERERCELCTCDGDTNWTSASSGLSSAVFSTAVEVDEV